MSISRITWAEILRDVVLVVAGVAVLGALLRAVWIYVS